MPLIDMVNVKRSFELSVFFDEIAKATGISNETAIVTVAISFLRDRAIVDPTDPVFEKLRRYAERVERRSGRASKTAKVAKVTG